jgi:hypothetical protein
MFSNKVESKNPKTHSTYKAIAQRMKNVGIEIDRHIAADLEVWESTLDGIRFCMRPAADKYVPNDITAAFRSATTPAGPAFREGGVKNQAHWAFDASMANTTGIGFREIWRPVLTEMGTRKAEMREHQLSLGTPRLDSKLSQNFTRAKKLDIPSLHAAVHGHICSIHIDEAGFVMGPIPGLTDDVSLTPQLSPHVLIELILRDKLKVPEFATLVVPDAYGQRMGVQFDLVRSQKFNLSVRGTCGFMDCSDRSVTVNAYGRHDLLGGGGG